jgi:hypothetical protein
VNRNAQHATVALWQAIAAAYKHYFLAFDRPLIKASEFAVGVEISNCPTVIKTGKLLKIKKINLSG